MRIVQLIYSLTMGGAERFVVNLSNELARKGNEVTVVQLLDDSEPRWTFNRQFLDDEVRFRSLGFCQGFSIKKVRKVCQVIDEISPDIVHCHLNVIPYVFPITVKKNRPRIFHTIHSIAAKASGAKYQRVINKWFYKNKKILPVAISGECFESFVDFYGFDDFTFIDNGASAVTKSAVFESVMNEIESYKPNVGTKVLIHAARCTAPKNQQLLISAVNRLIDDGEDIMLIVMGSDYDSPLGLELQKMASDRIHFLGVKSNVGDYLLNADYFCLSSIFEGLPISLLEAFSAGVTPVCTAVGGVSDVIVDGKNGYLAETVTEEDYVAALCRALSGQIDRSVLKQEFSEKYSVAHCADKYIKLFNEE